MFLINDYTRMTWVTFLKEKYETFENFKAFKSLVENETDLKIKFLRSNRGGNFTYYEFDEFCENNGMNMIHVDVGGHPPIPLIQNGSTS